MDYFYISTKS